MPKSWVGTKRLPAYATMTHVRESFLAGEVICDIGQVTMQDRRAMDRFVRDGSAIKWRGHWFPIAGASFGIGPLKTCWAIQRSIP
jgi:hypothetical protein